MTDKQHCGHECVCGNYEGSPIKGREHLKEPCDPGDCPHDTRSNPIDLSTVPKKALVEELAKREGSVTIKESVAQWRFTASDIKEAKMRLQEEIDSMVEDNVKAGVMQVKKP